ncbi:DUF4347 domain-containing protein, partial [Candidatus Micrarchaeota archaeon]|nr:DUF4347 domain-containing protein [Candidatus Micrarchaeota archaeon]
MGLIRLNGRVATLARRLTLEQLEERIVLEASGISTENVNNDNQVFSDSEGQAGSEGANEGDSTEDSSEAASIDASEDGYDDPLDRVYSQGLNALIMPESLEGGNAAGDGADSSEEVRVLIVASGLKDSQDLVDAAKSGVITIYYDGGQENPESLLSSIEAALDGKRADSIAFAAHNSGDAQVYMSKGHSLTLDSLARDGEVRAFWQGIGSMLAEGGRIDLLACDLSASEDGLALVGALEDLTGRDVAASDDDTGNSEAGGDWILETGNVDAAALYFTASALAQYDGILANTAPELTLSDNIGSLDPTFDFDGKAINIIGNAPTLQSVAIQPDGKILLGGSTFVLHNIFGQPVPISSSDFALMRLNSDGSLDTTFGNGGIVTT